MPVSMKHGFIVLVLLVIVLVYIYMGHLDARSVKFSPVALRIFTRLRQQHWIKNGKNVSSNSSDAISATVSSRVSESSTAHATLSLEPHSNAMIQNLERLSNRHNESEFSNYYERFHGNKPFFMRCKTCALVSSSGTMLGSGAGQDIDGSDCVVRMNDAPTKGFENDVGSRTTYRVFAHSSLHYVTKFFKSTKGAEIDSTLFLVWGPQITMKKGASTNKQLRSLVRTYPKIELYTFKEDMVRKADQIFEDETGSNRLKSGAYLSTGWFTMLFIRNVCSQINIYGMVEDDHCEKVRKKLFSDVAYHYYDKSSTMMQCSTYNSHEAASKAAHRYVTEKRVFKKWAKSWGNVEFHHPPWDFGS